MKKAKWSEVPPYMRKSRIQKVNEILRTIAMGIFVLVALFATVVLILVCALCYTY